jgi:hypothetical protein
MVDRASSSRTPQGDRFPNRSRQDSSHRSARDQHVTTWNQQLDRYGRQTDQQASTSRGLDDDTYDKWQKHFAVLLDDYRFCLDSILKESKEIQDKVIEDYRQKFQRANESEQEEYVKDLRGLIRSFQPDKFEDNEQITIDKELGYFFKSQFEELRDVREAALTFLAERIEKKIENGIEVKIEEKSDKLAEIRKWTQALDDYFTNHEQRVTSLVYDSVSRDMKFIYEHDLDKIRNAKNAENEYIYKNNDEKIYFIVKEINQSLYSAQDRKVLMQQNRIEAEREWANTANMIQELYDEMFHSSYNSDDEERRNHSSYDSNDEGRRSTIISSDNEESRSTSSRLLEQSEMERAIQQSLEQSEMERAIQQSLEQSNPRINSHRDLEGTATGSDRGSLIRAQIEQIFERIRQIVRLYSLEHDQRPQIQEMQGLKKRYEVIDVSHIVSPQIIDLGDVLRQQVQRMWRRMLRSGA